MFFGTPSPGNPKAVERFAANRFSITRQLRYPNFRSLRWFLVRIDGISGKRLAILTGLFEKVNVVQNCPLRRS